MDPKNDVIIHHGMNSEEFRQFTEEISDTSAKKTGEEIFQRMSPLLSYDPIYKKKTEIMWDWFGFRTVFNRPIPVYAWLRWTLGVAISAIIVLLMIK